MKLPFNVVNQLFIELQNQVEAENNPEEHDKEIQKYRDMSKNMVPKMPSIPKVQTPNIKI